MTKSFLKNIALALTLGVGLTSGGLAVACLGLWLIGLLGDGDAMVAGHQPRASASSAMR